MTEKDALIGVNFLLTTELVISTICMLFINTVRNDILFGILFLCIACTHTIAGHNIDNILKKEGKINE